MKGIKIVIPIIMVVILCAAFIMWHKNVSTPKARTYTVAVVHSWYNKGEDGELFQQLIKQEFHNMGYDTEIHHFYFNSIRHDSTEMTDVLWNEKVDSILRIHSDIVLINDDPALDSFLDRYPETSPFGETPIVFAGINVLQREKLAPYKNCMTGFEDKIDLKKNLEIYTAMTGSKDLLIELDDTQHDRLLKGYLKEQVKDTTYHIRFVSCTDPINNEGGIEGLRQAMSDAETCGHMQVKYDIFSNELLDRSSTAQYTCIREMFNDQFRLRLLCGYFTSTKIQIEDQVSYAAQIFEGVPVNNLPIVNHAKDYFLDYNAYSRYNGDVTIDECKKMFRVINMPFKIADPVLYYIIISLISIVLLSVLIMMAIRIYRWFSSINSETIDLLERQGKLRQMIFRQTDFAVWHSDNGKLYVPREFAERNNISIETPVKDFAEYISEDTKTSWNIVSNHPLHLGTHRLRLCISFDGHKTWNWYEVVFKSTPETAKTMKMSGIFQNINDIIAKENEMKMAREKMNETELKESFLANISHDLRTPLNAVTGFSNLLTMTDEEMSFSKEEQREFCDIIHQNSEMMINMINSVIGDTVENMADIKMKLLPHSVKSLVNETFVTNNILTPKHLYLKLEQPEDDAVVLIDIHRTKQVINNFISNAFKFTPSGGIIVGWRHLNDNADDNQGDGWIEIYVKDTGIGISEEEQDHLFDRFYKVKEHAKGTGLGLDISKTIMEKQDGRIGVTSTLGKGSCFFIQLKKEQIAE